MIVNHKLMILSSEYCKFQFTFSMLRRLMLITKNVRQLIVKSILFCCNLNKYYLF